MSSSGKPWWREVPTVIAVIGLLGTLLFNTLAVWMQLGQSKQTQKAAELGLLTQLNGLAHQAERQTAGVYVALCNGDPANLEDEAALLEAAQHYDYLAWLFNHDHIRVPSARSYWSGNMITTYELVLVQDKKRADARFANLRQFKFATPENEWPPELGKDCP
jgi:hypothetical protein